MRFSRLLISMAVVILVPAAGFSQPWEIGGGVGWGFAKSNTVRNATGSADTGPKNGLIATAYGSHQMYKHLSGEVRYDFRKGNPRVKSAGQEAELAGESHAIHYDFLLHMKDTEQKVRPYFAFGGGAKVFRGTGVESAEQPLSDFVLLTAVTETLPLLSVGGGVHIQVSPSVALRFDFRDHISPFPSKIHQPAPGAEVRGWLHDFLPMVTIGIRF